MYNIKHAKITGIWGWKTIETDFYDDVSIFIGANGTGKTTFINILIAILRVDLFALETSWFEEATITFETVLDGGRKKKRTMSVIRDSSSTKGYDDVVKYKISRKPFEFPLLNGKNIKSIYAKRIIFPVVEELKSAIKDIISFSSLSVSRAGVTDIDDYDALEFKNKNEVNTSIDNTLGMLVNKLKVFQLKKAEQLKEIAKEFQEEVFISVLYNKDIDSSVGLREITNDDLKNELRAFQRTYAELGIQNRTRKGKAKQLITLHFAAIQESIDYLKNTVESKKEIFDVDKIFAFPLLKRTRLILDAGKTAEEKRRQIFLPLDTYFEEINSYFHDKTVSLDADGVLVFVRCDKNEAVISDEFAYDYSKLSSGEKQVLILLTEALLQEGKSKLFIADEPELSLHIDWQSRIIPSVRRLNENAQIIVATHSPEVAGEYPSNILDMEDICCG